VVESVGNIVSNFSPQPIDNMEKDIIFASLKQSTNLKNKQS